MPIFLLIILLAGGFGWWQAHQTIAQECDRLNQFYVGEATYICGRKP